MRNAAGLRQTSAPVTEPLVSGKPDALGWLALREALWEGEVLVGHSDFIRVGSLGLLGHAYRSRLPLPTRREAAAGHHSVFLALWGAVHLVIGLHR